MKSQIIELLTEKPGLKGREIAKKIGKDKKEVNSFLYHEDSDLFVERDYRWFLKEDTIIRFEKDGWLTPLNFENLLQENKDLWDEGVSSIRFEFSKCSILLSAISRILCLVNQLALYEKKVTLDFSDCHESFTYLCRVGLFETLHSTVEVIPEIEDRSCYYGKNKKVMEFVSIPANTEQTDLPTKLKSSFIELVGKEHANAAFGFMSEFINNIIEHSDTPIPGVAALQVYGKGSGRAKVQTVFSDSGKGIIGTLRPVLPTRYPKLNTKYPIGSPNSDAGLLKEVFEFGGVSGANDINFSGRGLGLKVSAKQAAKFDARICVRQEELELTLKYSDGQLKDHSIRTDLKKILGTHICFDFFID